MSKQSPTTDAFSFYPVTADRLADLTRFSDAHGKFRYCSCMRWRLASTEYRQSTKKARRAALADWVSRGVPVGVLASVGDEPIGWCSIAPRESYAALERSRVLPRLDDEPVWSVVCFFVDRRYRGQGLTEGLLCAALDYARAAGAGMVEGYPVAPDAASYTYMGSPETFLRAGFRDVTPPGQARTVMRYRVG